MNRYQLLQKLKDATVTCHDCGIKYGIPQPGDSTMWHGTCHVCDQNKVVTEARDYAYFMTGISKLRSVPPDCSGVRP